MDSTLALNSYFLNNPNFNRDCVMWHTEPVVARSAVQGNRSPTSATITFPPPLTDRAARLSLPNSVFYAVLVSNSKNMRIKCLLKVSKNRNGFYEDIVSPKNQRNYCQDFCPFGYNNFVGFMEERCLHKIISVFTDLYILL